MSLVRWGGTDDNHKQPGRGFVPLEEQCGYGLLPHFEGRAYSAMAKYKFACGGLGVVLLQRQASRRGVVVPRAGRRRDARALWARRRVAGGADRWL